MPRQPRGLRGACFFGKLLFSLIYLEAEQASKRMARVKFTPNLQRFFPDLRECQVEAATIAEAIAAVDARWRGLGDYIVDEQGALRKHVNIFVGDELIRDKITLSDRLSADSKIYIMQALSGG